MPQRCAITSCSRRYFSGVKLALNACRRLGIIVALATPSSGSKPTLTVSDHARTVFCNPASLRLEQKLPAAHDRFTIYPYVKIPPHHVNVGRRIPVRAGMSPVRIAERNVHSRILLILQDLSDHVLQVNVRPDSEFTNPVAIFVGVRVTPEIVLQFLIRAVPLG